MTSTADFVNDNYAILVSKFDESTTLGDSVMTYLRKMMILLLNIPLFGSTLMKKTAGTGP